jgi:hypothetical protein
LAEAGATSGRISNCMATGDHRMTPDDVKRGAASAPPPPGLSPALRALWWVAGGDWERAHEVVMGEDDADAAWVHAHLHRIEGDIGNARYWYRRAGQPAETGLLEAEWAAITAAMLHKSPPGSPA